MWVQIAERSVTVPACRDSRDLRAVPFDDLALAALHGTKRLRFGSRKAVANQVVRIVDVLLEVVPEPAGEGLPAGIEQLGPGIGAPEDGVRDHHAGQRPERQAVARVSGRRVLMVGARPMYGQAIGRLDHLTRPAMRQLDVWHDRAQLLLERA